MTISLKADPSGNFGSILINGTEAVRVNPGGIPASSTAFTPSGNIAATNVQAAIQELDSETQAGLATKVSKSGGTMTGMLTVPGITVTPGQLVVQTPDSSRPISLQNTTVGSTVQFAIDYEGVHAVLRAPRTGADLKLSPQSGIVFVDGGAPNGPPEIRFNHAGVGRWKQVVDASGAFFTIYGDTSNGVYIPANGNAWVPNSSDARKKRDFAPMYGLAELMQIEPVKYRYLEDSNEQAVRLGFTAQNLKPVIPEVVYDKPELAEDGTPFMTVSPTDMIPVLVQAVKELSAKLDAAVAEIAALKADK